jgi:nitrogen fixation/metabolism regulation signal transduction histidine kinase
MITDNPGHTVAAERNSEGTPAWLLAMRHAVAMLFVLAATHLEFYTNSGMSEEAWWTLCVKTALIVVVAAVLSGLWALFFTARSRGRISANYVRLMWVLVALIEFGEWSSIPAVQAIIAAAFFVAAALEWFARRTAGSQRQKKTDTTADSEISGLRNAFLNGARIEQDALKTLVVAAKEEPRLAMLCDRMKGRTLLHLCAQYNLIDEAALLVRLGADPYARDGNGRRPIDLTNEPSIRDLLVAPRPTSA